MSFLPEPASKDEWTLFRNARQLLTLQGPSGPRRGSAMSELNIVPRGALLIRNGMIEDVGPGRRVENLAAARQAHEIDAAGKIIMPAFVDADVSLVTPRIRESGDSAQWPEAPGFRPMSRKTALARAGALSCEYARYGTVTVGAHTRYADDLKNIAKVLRAHQALQMKPQRIRSVFSPRFAPGGSRTPPSRWKPFS